MNVKPQTVNRKPRLEVCGKLRSKTLYSLSVTLKHNLFPRKQPNPDFSNLKRWNWFELSGKKLIQLVCRSLNGQRERRLGLRYGYLHVWPVKRNPAVLLGSLETWKFQNNNNNKTKRKKRDKTRNVISYPDHKGWFECFVLIWRNIVSRIFTSLSPSSSSSSSFSRSFKRLHWIQEDVAND